MNTLTSNQQQPQQQNYQGMPLSPQETTPSKHAVELVTLMNPAPTQGSPQYLPQPDPAQSGPQPHYGGFPMTRRNYTYTANVATQKTPPFAGHPHPHTLPQPVPVHANAYNTPQLSARASGAGTPMLMIRRESFQPLSSGASPVYEHHMQMPAGLGNSASPVAHGFRGVSFDRGHPNANANAHAHRHSINMGSLDHHYPNGYALGSIPGVAGDVHSHAPVPAPSAAMPNGDVPLVAVQPHRASMPVIKTEVSAEDMPLPAEIPEERRESSVKTDNSAVHNVGERYNARGELIGRSGKVLRDTKRAAQNRSAQKAFRVRREKYIKNLELKAKHFDEIVAENVTLKRLVADLESREREVRRQNEELHRAQNEELQKVQRQKEEELQVVQRQKDEELLNAHQQYERRLSGEIDNYLALQSNFTTLKSKIQQEVCDKLNQFPHMNVEFESFVNLINATD
ncbi:Cin5 protein [Maudiozyma humilis]|uniref:Cin5 protein n=1 Tax=Maudiozyma humilis TaxID=51915 RepID=A0AAV5RPJ6_MAUHU|nr:Cin5 protein [Kazachstania humilis]